MLPYNKLTSTKKRFKTEKTEEEKKKLALLKKELTKKKKAKKGRLIIRNLSFEVEEEELRKVLSQFGNVTEITIPKKPDGKKKGFAFVQYEKFTSSILAIKHLNYKPLHGRPVALDYALPKSKYEHVISSRKVSEIDEQPADGSDANGEESDASSLPEASEGTETKMEIDSEDDHKQPADEKSRQVHQFLKELQFDAASEDENSESQNDDDGHDSDSQQESSEDENEKEEGQSEKHDSGRSGKCNKLTRQLETNDDSQRTKTKLCADDTQEGKTVFVRNISFGTSEESLKEAMKEFGVVKYCVFCIDQLTEHPKGTAFVKFENKEDAEKLIDKANSGDGLFLDGRKLYCSLAVSREEIKRRTESDHKKKKDKRNLHLLREGLIMPNSEEAEGVSQADLAKRAKLEMVKKQKLKNFNFFVSDKRLCVHNLPQNFTDKKLRELFKNAVGKNAFITEARVMKDLKKVNEKGEPRSKGFGFVSFTRHEDALLALQKINNDRSVFTPQKRPIVEFSVENHLALLKKERRRERNRLYHKKRKESVNEPADNQATVKEVGQRHKKFSGGKKKDVQNTKKVKSQHKKLKKDEGRIQIKKKNENHEIKSSKKVKTKKKGRRKPGSKVANGGEDFKKLVQQHKKTLLNKLK